MILCSCSLCNLYLSQFPYLIWSSQQSFKIRRAGMIISVFKGRNWDSTMKSELLLWHTHHKWALGESERWGKTLGSPSESMFLLLGNAPHTSCLLILGPVIGWIVSLPNDIEILTPSISDVTLFGSRLIASCRRNQLRWGHTGLGWIPHWEWLVSL